MTIRETVLQAVKSALNSVSGVSGRVYRQRAAAFIRNEAPAINIEVITDVPAEQNLGRLTWEMTFSVTVMVRAEVTESFADSIVADIHKKVMTDSALNAIVIGVDADVTSWSVHEADVPLGFVEMQFKATYQTSLNDLESL